MRTISAAKHKLALSAQYSNELAQVTPGGVNSLYRSFAEVGGHTIFFSKALGSKLFDVDGNVYIDYLGGWGPAVLGHCHPEVIAACQQTLSLGPVLGTPHEFELQFAKLLIDAIPSLEQVRFVNSGTEAVMSAARLARGHTGRNKIIMFEGGYDGHSDVTLASSTHASSTGIPTSVAQHTLLVEFNNLDALESCLQANKDDVAAVLIEPVAGSMSVVTPEPGYLQGIRELCTAYGALLIFDEVLTGFRLAFGGAQALYQVRPDITCFGKALAGGMPVGAYGGSREIMSNLLPVGKVYQAGTFSGNPVTMAGGIATIRLLSNPSVFQKLESVSARFFKGLQTSVDQLGVPVQLQRVGSMFAIIFAAKPIKNYRDSLSIDSPAFAKFFHYVLDKGVYLPPSSVDAAFVSAAHTDEEIDFTIDVCHQAFKNFSQRS